MIMKFGVKHGFLDYKEWEIRFPTEEEKQHLEVLSIAHQKRIMNYIESNCDYKTVSVILGHSNISTTLDLYVHPNMEQKKKCIDKMYKGLK